MTRWFDLRDLFSCRGIATPFPDRNDVPHNLKGFDAEIAPRRVSPIAALKHTIFALFFTIATLVGASMPTPAEAGKLSEAVRGAIAKRSVKQLPAQQVPLGKPANGKPRDVVVQRAKHPEAAAHIEHAQKNGQPTVLHIDRAGAAKRRAAAIGTVNPHRKPAPRYERDEYPPAFTREGGSNANVRFINPHDNRGAGSSMRAQTSDLTDGSKIRILVK